MRTATLGGEVERGFLSNDVPEALLLRAGKRCQTSKLPRFTKYGQEPRKFCQSTRVHFITTEQWGYAHESVCHSSGEYAQDDDGDGFHEVHVNTMKGFWSLLRPWLRLH